MSIKVYTVTTQIVYHFKIAFNAKSCNYKQLPNWVPEDRGHEIKSSLSRPYSYCGFTMRYRMVPGPLEKQPVHLTTEPSLQLHSLLCLKTWIRSWVAFVFLGNKWILWGLTRQESSRGHSLVENLQLVFSVHLVCLGHIYFLIDLFPVAQGGFHPRKYMSYLHHDPNCLKFLLWPINYNEKQGSLILPDDVLWKMAGSTSQFWKDVCDRKFHKKNLTKLLCALCPQLYLQYRFLLLISLSFWSRCNPGAGNVFIYRGGGLGGGEGDS